METRIKWLDGISFVAHSGSGHSVVMDGGADAGGQDLGVRPMELLLMGLGGCAGIDVVVMLRKSRQKVVDCEIRVSADRSEQIPRVFTQIRVHFIVSGRDLSERHVRRAVDLSAEKYCSASIMLGKAVEILHDFEIIESPD